MVTRERCLAGSGSRSRRREAWDAGTPPAGLYHSAGACLDAVGGALASAVAATVPSTEPACRVSLLNLPTSAVIRRLLAANGHALVLLRR